MKTMLMLTDFSEAAFRAAEYACDLIDPLQVGRIILFHSFQAVVVGTDLPASTVLNDREIYLNCMESLGLVHDRLKPLAGPTVKIDLLAEDTTLSPDSINELCRKEAVDLVVVGVSGKSGLEKLLMGSVTAQLLRSVDYPLLVVPQNAMIGKTVNNIALSTDLKDHSLIPVNLLHDFLGAFPASLQVVNVLPEEKERYSTETEASIAALQNILKKYDPVFHYIQGDDIVENILSFASKHHISLIIAIPKKHGFFSTVFHQSITKKMAYHSHVPLLCLPALHE